MLKEANSSDEEIRRMITALRNLRMFTEHSYNGKSTKEFDLHWDSWDRNQVSEMNGSTSNVSLAGSIRNGSSSGGMHSPRVQRNQLPSSSSRPRASETDDTSNNSSLKCSPISPQSSSSNCPFSPTLFAAYEDDVAAVHQHSPSSSASFPPKSNLPGSNLQGSNLPGSNPPGSNPPRSNPDKSSSPPATYTRKSTASSTGDGSSRTPPPAKKHQTLLSEPFPLTKSKSHEEHLSNRIQIDPIRSVPFLIP